MFELILILIWLLAIIIAAFPQILTRFFKGKEDKQNEM